MSDPNYLVALKQLRESELSTLISGLFTLGFSGLADAYSNYYKFAHTTGNETISGLKTFTSSPEVPYSGTTGTAISLKYVQDREIFLQNNINVLTTGATLAAHLSGRETFFGEKTFENILINSGRATGRFEVPYPVNSSGAISLEYLTSTIANINQFTIFNSGEQWISGIKYFTDDATVYLPTATHTSGGVPLSQLDATGTSLINRLVNSGIYFNNRIDSLDMTGYANVTGFAGVLAINAESGAIFTQGRGSVTTTQNGNVLNISGHSLIGYTGAYLGYTPLLSGVDRQFIEYGRTFESIPYVFAQLESPSGNSLMNYYVSGRDTYGFSVVFSNTLITSGYGLSYIAWTGLGSIVNTIQGQQGVTGQKGEMGGIGYIVNNGTITGNFVNLTMYLDPVFSGFSVAEAFVNNSFLFTGFAMGCTQTGSKLLNGGTMSGNIYQRGQDNVKYPITGFQFDSGVYFAVSGGYNNTITGLNRIGLDITNSMSGIRGFSLGIFGVSNVGS